MLIKDLAEVKDEEITLRDVRRAEEIIARANKLLGKTKECNHYHYNGWSYFTPSYNPNYISCLSTGTTTITAGSMLSSNPTIVEVANMIA